jgi:hypothetical protein
MVNRRFIQFQRKEGTIEKSDSIYLGLKQRYGSPGIAVERDVLIENNRVSVSKYRVKSLWNCTS